MWGGQMEALRRLVYLIRREKPDVIFSNHNTVGGHGHHQAAALTALAAFDAASDSTMFPNSSRRPEFDSGNRRRCSFGCSVAARTRRMCRTISKALTPCEVLPISILRRKPCACTRHKGWSVQTSVLSRGGGVCIDSCDPTARTTADSTTFFSGIDLWRDASIASLATSADWTYVAFVRRCRVTACSLLCSRLLKQIDL